ncbi:hypothetical protein K461DRAFT_310046 [Myriangium duriaei CBS 260.36]|uniref:MIF4G domain-containing protein n=1 Tax=Myriangium duriaei CBS 260.36 TaxID=1168546 RepID=A0A9P4MT24_9PEZI|nr:hypothetical protein K461DRAFT_310046 [Myriangium duriaei CBS 260.36]
MAEVDRYPDSRNRHGGGGGRKRRFQDDDGGGRPHQRRRFDPPGTRLRKKMLGLLDSSFHTPEQDIREIAQLAVQHGGDEYVRDTFCDLAVSISMEQPCKTIFVAAAVVAVNKHRPELTTEVLEKLALLVSRNVRAGKWRDVKLALRLLACLQGIYSDDGILPVLEELFQRTIDLQTANPEETVGPELVKVILLTIPYLMASSTDGLHGKVDELLQKTDVVASTPHVMENLVDPYPNDDPAQKPMACASLLSLLQKQLQNEAAEGWTLACFPKVLDLDINVSKEPANGDHTGEQNGDENQAEENGDAAMTDAAVNKHAFPSITIPDAVNPGRKALFPEIYYSVFADQEVESVPPTSNLASTVIRDAIVDTVDLLDYNRSFVGKFVIDLDNYWAPDTFVKRATPFDKLRDVPADKPKWKPEDMAIDAIFSQLLRIPTPGHKAVYYHSVIMEACKLAPSAIAPSLGRAIRFTFRSLADLDLELVHRFTDWFAHHVSNFEFRWKWTEWNPEVGLPDLHPKKAFILSAIEKEIRLSFPKRIADSLPPDFASLIAKAQYNDQPDFKFNNASTPYSQQGKALLTTLKDKATADDAIQEILDEVSSLATAQGADGDIASTDVFITCICHIGSKSLSHILSSIDKNRNRLLAIGSASEPAARQIITSVMDYWAYHPGQAINIVDKLLNYTIVTPQSVVDWALSDHLDRGKALARPGVWEMVWATMNKVAHRLGDIAIARASPGMEEQHQVIDETLVRERGTMRNLMRQIEDVAAGVAGGAQDGMVEELDDGSGELELLKGWGGKWLRVWRRKMAVEEARSGEAGVKALEEVMRLEKEVEAEVRADEEEDRQRREEQRVKREEERRARFEAREKEREERQDDDGRGRADGRGEEVDDVA